MRADLVVIGSGAGGAPLAATLAEAGLEVVVLEAGERLSPADFDGDASRLLPRLMQASSAADSGMEIYAGSCVGGSTLVNDALCWRPPPEVLAGWRETHGLPGLSEAAFAPHVERVWRDIHVTPTGRAHLSRNAHVMERGAAELGWAAEAMPRNVRGCASLGLCNLGCPTSAKQSTLLTYLPRAEAAGARVLASTRARRIEARADGGYVVEAERLGGAQRLPESSLRIETPRVCVAAGVLDSPALLLRSGMGGARSGANLQFHSTVYVTARFREEIHGYYGPTMAYAVSEFADVNGHAGPGFMLENVTVSPVTTAGALPGFGESHERVMAQLPHLARALVVLRDRSRGRLELDAHGGRRIGYRLEAGDLERLRQAIGALARLFLAAGAEEVYLPVNRLAPVRSEAELAALESVRLEERDFSLLYSVHLFGGACMAGSPERGVCDESGRVWGAPGVWVSDASALPGNTGVNPQVTVMANALRVAEAIRADSGRPS